MITEMVDGAVLVRPSPGFAHVDALLTLAGLLRAAAPPDLRVLTSPFPVRLGRRTRLRPDLLVARYADLLRDELAAPPLLAVDVGGELGIIRRVVYGRHGVPSYWTLDPEVPALTAFELDAAGEFRTVAEVAGGERFVAVRPFRVSVCPIELVAGLRPC
jgi:Uma2 family endonuclease